VPSPVQILVELVADTGDLGLVVLLPALPLRLVNGRSPGLAASGTVVDAGGGSVIHAEASAEQLAGAVPAVQPLQLQRAHLLEGPAPYMRYLLLIVLCPEIILVKIGVVRHK